MERKFEKISYKQFSKDIINDKELYENYKKPKRSTKTSAGYDFFSYKKITIKPNEIVKVPTGIKAKFNKGEVLFIVIRSSMGFKYNIRLCNQVGVIDSDYYNNIDNEGHIYIALKNEGIKDYIVEKNSAFAQGIFSKFLITTDDEVTDERKGGIGSTN